MQTIEFTVNGTIRGKARPRFTKQGHAYTPENTRDYEELVRQAYDRAAEGLYFGGPVRLDILCRHRTPKASRQKTADMQMGLIRPQVRPDIDNVAKIIMDALNGAAYKDDSQVCELHVTKCYDEEASVKIRLTDAVLHC